MDLEANGRNEVGRYKISVFKIIKEVRELKKRRQGGEKEEKIKLDWSYPEGKMTNNGC